MSRFVLLAVSEDAGEAYLHYLWTSLKPPTIGFKHEKMETIPFSYAYVTPSLHCLCLCLCLRLCLCRSVDKVYESTECWYLHRLLNQRKRTLARLACLSSYLQIGNSPSSSVCFEFLSSAKKGNTFKLLLLLKLYFWIHFVSELLGYKLSAVAFSCDWQIAFSV